jgi:circadian clock protein KaiB
VKKIRGDHASVLAKAAKTRAKQNYVLRLYVAGITPKSEGAIRSVKEVCDQRLKGRYDLEIIDIYQQVDALRQDQIVVAPTLIRKLPLPLRRLIGDMADRDKILLGLDLATSSPDDI